MALWQYFNSYLTDNKPKEVEAETTLEGSEKKYKYPRSIPFIIVNEFCERFNYYGMRGKWSWNEIEIEGLMYLLSLFGQF